MLGQQAIDGPTDSNVRGSTGHQDAANVAGARLTSDELLALTEHESASRVVPFSQIGARLGDLRAAGVLTETELAAAKRKLLDI